MLRCPIPVWIILVIMRGSLSYDITLVITIWSPSARLTEWEILFSFVSLTIPWFFLSVSSSCHLLFKIFLILSFSLLWRCNHWNRRSRIRQWTLLPLLWDIARCIIRRCTKFLTSLFRLSCGFLHILPIFFLLFSSSLFLTTNWISKEAVSHRGLFPLWCRTDWGRNWFTNTCLRSRFLSIIFVLCKPFLTLLFPTAYGICIEIIWFGNFSVFWGSLLNWRSIIVGFKQRGINIPFTRRWLIKIRFRRGRRICIDSMWFRFPWRWRRDVYLYWLLN